MYGQKITARNNIVQNTGWIKTGKKRTRKFEIDYKYHVAIEYYLELHQIPYLSDFILSQTVHKVGTLTKVARKYQLSIDRFGTVLNNALRLETTRLKTLGYLDLNKHYLDSRKKAVS